VTTPLVGVLALQGGFDAHARMLRALGAEVREVRTPADLEGLDGLVMPGGESTTMTLGIEREGLAEPLREFGKPIFGTCAGLILLDRAHLGLMDIVAERNAFGRQLHSFEEDLEFPEDVIPPTRPVRAVFIRAPWIVAHGPEVQVLASVDGHPVAARQGSLLAISFHPELGDDDRLHRAFLQQVRASRDTLAAQSRRR
jgi:pyridoxal 5'-phosphate synthase pdxT subunit